MDNYRYTTYARRPDLLGEARRVNGSAWPEFMFHDAGRRPTTLCAIQATVDRSLQGQGLSRMVLRGMRHRAVQAALATLLTPVRPTLRCQYPLLPMERYIRLRSTVKPIGAVISNQTCGCGTLLRRQTPFYKEDEHVA